MNKIGLGGLLFLSLAFQGCSTIGTQPSPQQVFVEACASYGALLNTAVQLRTQGQASPDLIAQLNVVEPTLSDSCKPGTPLPSDPSAIILQLNNAISAIGPLEVQLLQNQKKQ